MEEQLSKILKKIKSIAPEEGFLKRSKDLILSARQNKFGFDDLRTSLLESFKWGAALTLASLLLFVLVGGLTYSNLEGVSPAILSNLNDIKLRNEVNNLDFQIRLDEISYSSQNDKAIGQKIDELLDELTL
ncbi:MAG: hypothetical protein AAB646_02165 [Patescibacteria group bacterium]